MTDLGDIPTPPGPRRDDPPTLRYPRAVRAIVALTTGRPEGDPPVKILVATDGSPHAIDAAARGLAVLGAAESVTLLCVVHTPAVVSSGMESGFAGGMATPEVVDAAWVGAKEEADASIDRTIAALPGDLPYERRVETGEPGLAIVAAAEEIGADVIVIGSRGRGAIKRALLGSVSSHVVHNASCPVVVTQTHDA